MGEINFWRRNMMRKKLWLVCLCLAAVLVTGCNKKASGTESGGKYKIGVSIPSAEYTFFAQMESDIKKAYPSDRAEVTVFDGQNNQQKQNQDVEDMITQKYNGIVLIPITVEGAVPAIEYANKQKVPIITVDREVAADTGVEVIGFVGADHRPMGVESARLLIAAMEKMFPGESSYNVVELLGTQGSSAAIFREEGIHSVFDQDPRIKYISLDANFATPTALSVTEDQLTANPNLHGVVAHNDDMAEGAYQALVNANKVGQVAITGIDGKRSMIELVAKGGTQGTVIQYPRMVTMGVEVLCDYLDGNQIQYTNFYPTDGCGPDVAQQKLDEGVGF
jgi:ribose transport system substrate-binding protein